MKFAFEMIDKASGPANRIAAGLDRISNGLAKADKSTATTRMGKGLARLRGSLDKASFGVRLAFGDKAADLMEKFSKGQLKAADKAEIARAGFGAMGKGLGVIAGAAAATTAALLAVAAAGASAAGAAGSLLLDAQKYRDTTQAALTFQLGSAEAAKKTMGFLVGISRATGQDRRTVTEQFSKLVGSGLGTGESEQLVQLTASLKVGAAGQDIGVEKLGDALLSLKRNEALSVEKTFAGLLAAGGQNRVYEVLAKQLNIKSAGLDPTLVKRMVDQRLSGGPGGTGIRGQKAVDLFEKVHLEVANESAFGGLQQAFQAKTVTGAIDLVKQRLKDLFDDANAAPLATRLLGLLNRVAGALDPASGSGKQLLATLDRLIASAGDLWDAASPLVQAFGEGFGAGFMEAAETVSELVGALNVGQGSAVGFGDALRTIGTALGYVVVGIGAGLGAIAYLEAKLAGIAAFVVGAGSSIGLALIDGITNGLDSARARLVARLESLAQLLPDSVRKLLQIHSPSRVMMQLGAYSAEGFAQGIERGGTGVESATRASITAPVMAADVRRPERGRGDIHIAPGALVLNAHGASNPEEFEARAHEAFRKFLEQMRVEFGVAT